MVAPRWWRPALGHLLRGTVSPERFAGQIALAGLFQAGPGDLPWHWRLGPQLAGRIIHEQDFMPGQDCMATAGCTESWLAPLQDPGPVPANGHRQERGRSLLLLDRPHYSFAGLNGHAPLLRRDLGAITRPRQLQRAQSVPWAPIGINIRCGRDFRPPPAAGAGAEWIGWLQQTPLAWFMETLQAVRDFAGEPVPALVVSDGSEQQLRPLLDLPAVRLVRPTTAIIDLIVLSRTRLLLGSGSSSFSAWAAFLGQQTAITGPGHPFSRWDLEPRAGQTLASFQPRQPDPQVLGAMVAALGRPASVAF
ncbi:MAG: hypothetical protein WCO50_00040 [Synechococcus sp. ELA619]